MSDPRIRIIVGLATVLVASLLVVTCARAGEVRIPDAMLGSWCSVHDEEWLIPKSAWPLDKNGYPDCGRDYQIDVGRRDYSGHEVYCKIRNITRHGDALQVRARCKTGLAPGWDNETARLQLIENGTRLRFEIIRSTQ
jgi:hypothetical protein